ncbi:MAG: hypothetical protein AB1762_15115 [Gemmatimonadota bacterium]
MTDQDRDLARHFQEERVRDERRAPSFASVLAGSSPRPHRTVRWPVFATSVALVALVAVWRLTSAPAVPFELRAGDLRVPTDYLLDFATFPRAGDIPPIGSVDWFPLNDAAPTVETRRQQ